MNSGTGARWRILVIGTSIYLAFGLVSAAIAVMVGPIRAELGIAYGQMGVILGSWQFAYTFTALPEILALAPLERGRERAHHPRSAERGAWCMGPTRGSAVNCALG